MKIKKDITVTVDHEDLVDLLSAARYGISYWACDLELPDEAHSVIQEYKASVENADNICEEDFWAEVLLADLPIILYDAEGECADDPSKDYYELTVDKINRGIAQAIGEGIWNGKDWGDVDSEVADEIIQYALFDELVFG